MSPSVVPNGELPATQWSPSVPPAPEARARSADGIAASTLDVDDRPAFEKLPKVGGVFLGFELIGELGRGGFGRVYLAKQRELADRPVALKVTVGPDAESQNLARLQHTNIMPIHSVHKARRTVAVCMPFYGQTTLADLCSSLDTMNAPPLSGGYVVGTLTARRDSTQAALTSRADTRPDESTVRSPSKSFVPIETVFPNLSLLRTMSYVDAVLWIARRIADGLAHAHDRGIIHRDLKPANILLTDDGQPMILDFNLAIDTGSTRGGRGGTLPYMSPEQLRSVAGSDDPIDPRSDLYSLGILLAQLLGGRYPFPRRSDGSSDLIRQLIVERSGQLPKLRAGNKAISPTVEAIVHKCLAANPDDRYQSAHELIEDLDRHQAHQPTRFAANPSARERLKKWAKRNPRVTSPLMASAAVATLLLLATAGVGWGLVTAKRAELARNADRGREIVAEFESLHGVAEQYLTSHNGNPELITRGQENGFRALETLTDRRGDGWTDRPEFHHLPDADKQRLTRRASELVFLLSQAGGNETRGGDFWGHLADASPNTSRLTVLRAAELHAGGKFRESIPALQKYTRGHPDDAGGWFLLGRANAESGNTDDAYLAYSTGIALRPRYAAGYYFRAVIADRLRKADPASGQPQAILDADRAVDLDPEFVEGRLLRAQLRTRLKLLSDAKDDLDFILDRPNPPTRAWLLRAVVRDQLGDKTGAADDRAAGLKQEPTSAEDYIARGASKRTADPTAALADFRAAEKLDPLNTVAIENQAYVQAELLHRPDQAVDTLSRLLARTPHSSLAFISRAVYLARSGRTAEAVIDAKKAAELSTAPGIEYRVGCVYALAAKADPKYAAPALKHLSAALKAGFGYEHLTSDSDLDPLRGRAEFDRLTELTKLLNRLGGAE